MSLSTIFASIDKYIKIKPWLQFVGYMLAFGGLLGAALEVAHPLNLPALVGFVTAFVGLGVSMAGFDYTKIYP